MAFLDAEKGPREALCMEFAHGGSLHQHQDLSMDECGQVMKQLLSALSYLHGELKAHRDIKTSNVLVRYRGAGTIDVMFGDWGHSSNEERFRTPAGSLNYMAPELHIHHPRCEYTNAIDIWSLGVVGVEICKSLPRWRHHYKNEPLSWCDLLADQAKRMRELPVIRRMLVLHPDDRGSAQQCLKIHEPWTCAEWYDDQPESSWFQVLESIEDVSDGSGESRDDTSSFAGPEDRRWIRSQGPQPMTRSR